MRLKITSFVFCSFLLMLFLLPSCSTTNTPLIQLQPPETSATDNTHPIDIISITGSMQNGSAAGPFLTIEARNISPKSVFLLVMTIDLGPNNKAPYKLIFDSISSANPLKSGGLCEQSFFMGGASFLTGYATTYYPLTIDADIETGQFCVYTVQVQILEWTNYFTQGLKLS